MSLNYNLLPYEYLVWIPLYFDIYFAVSVLLIFVAVPNIWSFLIFMSSLLLFYSLQRLSLCYTTKSNTNKKVSRQIWHKSSKTDTNYQTMEDLDMELVCFFFFPFSQAVLDLGCDGNNCTSKRLMALLIELFQDCNTYISKLFSWKHVENTW